MNTCRCKFSNDDYILEIIENESDFKIFALGMVWRKNNEWYVLCVKIK
jgi:hypothetical protein